MTSKDDDDAMAGFAAWGDAMERVQTHRLEVFRKADAVGVAHFEAGESAEGAADMAAILRRPYKMEPPKECPDA
jgi:hypothetical protein